MAARIDAGSGFRTGGFTIFLAVIEAQRIEIGEVRFQAAHEVGEGRALSSSIEPGMLCEGAEAGHEHEFEFFHGRDTFAPEVGLHTDDLVSGN